MIRIELSLEIVRRFYVSDVAVDKGGGFCLNEISSTSVWLFFHVDLHFFYTCNFGFADMSDLGFNFLALRGDSAFFYCLYSSSVSTTVSISAVCS